MKDLLDSSTPRPATHRPDFRPPAPMTITAPDIHQGWLTAGKRPAGGDGPLATRGDDAAFARALASLTRRQRQIVRLRARGLTIAEIGDRYYLSENTVKNHLHAAFRILGLDNLRHQARLGRACYLLGRYEARREGGAARRQDGETSRESYVASRES
jgi:DNA-binding CsgD family transcriptional regulator